MPLVAAFLALFLNLIPSQTLFSDAERARLVEFWNAPGRYKVTAPPETSQTGPWQVRLTPEGSIWLHAYQKAIGATKAPPTQDAVGSSSDTTDWEKWVSAKVTYDRWKAQSVANVLNAAVRPPTGMTDLNPPISAPPPAPGVIPASLLASVGDPPPFASAVTPQIHNVSFEDGDAYALPDNVAMRPRYAYYRFPQGSVAYGASLREMPTEELDKLFAQAGLSPNEQRIARAVSRLEGGFDAVNTYDTGYVSVGFIQFVTMEDGKHSLSEVLQREKSDRPKEYSRDFRHYGVDVDDEGTLVVVDPSTGAELSGKSAVMKVIEDKRLIAVFQRAGRRSTAFRVAQIQVAKSDYWPAQDLFTVMAGGQALSGKVSDIVKSEAGMATLFDRKVNRGSIAPFAEVVTKVMADHHLATLGEAADYEREIVSALKYRADFLVDTSLSQPSAPAPKPEIAKPSLLQLAMRLAKQAGRIKASTQAAQNSPAKPPIEPVSTKAASVSRHEEVTPDQAPASDAVKHGVKPLDQTGSSSHAVPEADQTPPAPSR